MLPTLTALTALSLALLLWQWLEAVLFPLHRRRALPGFAPGLTLLKPLKGCDAETEVCLRSWLAQDYAGPLQTLFAVASYDDPAAEVVRRLIAEHPHRDIELVVCARRLGPNSKVSKLAQIEPRSKHDVVVVSDADVWVPPGFLTELVAPLQNSQVVLVNPFYELATPATLPMQWEALATNADFWSSVLQATRLGGMRFALGAVMAVRRAALEQIGGFAALVNHLADDYELGKRLTASRPSIPHSAAIGPAPTGAAGEPTPRASISLCPVVVACREAPRHWRSIWAHQLRWARTIRHCQPLPYAFSLLSNVTLWSLAWLLAARKETAVIGFIVCMALRVAMVAHCQRRLTRSWRHLPWVWLAPLKDLLQAALWIMSFVGSTVEWRGERFQVGRGGELKPRDRAAPQSMSPTISSR